MGIANYLLAGLLGATLALHVTLHRIDLSYGPLQPELDGGIRTI